MSKYSSTMAGILISVGGVLLGSFGLSDNCSSEIMSKLAPVLAGLPGAIIAWYGRIKAGGVTVGGFRK